MRLGLGAIGALVLLVGCPREPAPQVPRSERVRVRSFTESAPIRHLIAASPYVFGSTDAGLDRWDLRSGEVLSISTDHGLPGRRVEATAFDPTRRWLWLATDAGVALYHTDSGTFTEIAPPPSILGLDDLSRVTLEPSTDGGLWIGHSTGLYYTNTAGQWTNTGVTEPVNAVYHARDGWLWIGTDKGLVGRQPDGETFTFGALDGCDLASVRLIGRAPDGGPLVVGENAAGHQRIVLILGNTCASYRAAPEVRWEALANNASGTVILTEGGLYSLRVPSSGARMLRRDGMRLVPVPGERMAPRSPYVLRSLDLPMPAGALSLAAVDDEVLIGTRDLGIARLIAGRRRGRTRWLRRSILVDGAHALSVACQAQDDCYVATGGADAWRFDGQSFLPIDTGGAIILSFVRHPDGIIYALYRPLDRARVAIARMREGVLEPLDLEVETPGGGPELTFTRFSPGGILWLGLRYRDEVGEQRPFGVALVDLLLGAIVYHHATADLSEVREGVLPIPLNVVDVSFMGESEVWLATNEGAAQLRGNAVKVYSEADGLYSELLRGVAATSGGMVFVGSGQGVGMFDGQAWKHPRGLRYPINDLELGPDGRLWMATDRGVVVFDGATVRRLDRRRGLLENQIEDLALDHLGRIWARGRAGLTLITP